MRKVRTAHHTVEQEEVDGTCPRDARTTTCLRMHSECVRRIVKMRLPPNQSQHQHLTHNLKPESKPSALDPNRGAFLADSHHHPITTITPIMDSRIEGAADRDAERAMRFIQKLLQRPATDPVSPLHVA